MAETVVSMARSMLGGAISMATSAAAAELSLVMGVQKDIWFIKDELKTMQAFLAAAEATKNRDMLLKVWAEQILKKCTHFEWMDEYVERIQFEGYIDSSGAATWELNLGGVPQMENLGSSDIRAGRVVPMARYACNAELHLESELTGELKKIKKNLMEMIDLQKQANFMAGGFYCCIIALFLFYLLFILH